MCVERVEISDHKSRDAAILQRRSSPTIRRNNQIGTGDCPVKGFTRPECSPREDYNVHLLNLAYRLFHSAQTQTDPCREYAPFSCFCHEKKRIHASPV